MYRFASYRYSYIIVWLPLANSDIDGFNNFANQALLKPARNVKSIHIIDVNFETSEHFAANIYYKESLKHNVI